MGRYQRGHVSEQHSAFHVRYYTPEVIDGQPKRVQRSDWLCSKDNKHHSTKCKPVQQLAAGVMERVHAKAGMLSWADIKIADLRRTVYFPHIERNTKASTITGYKKIWEGHRRGFLRLELKPGQRLCVLDHFIREEFEGDKPVQGQVLGFVDYTHSAAAELLEDAIVRYGLTDHWSKILRP